MSAVVAPAIMGVMAEDTAKVIHMYKLIVTIIIAAIAIGANSAYAFSPQVGDSFKYYEAQDLGNGTGTYDGYWEHTIVTGGEQMNSVTNGVVAANYSYSWTFTNSSGSHTTGGQAQPFTYSASNFGYITGSDQENPSIYTNPTVWFAMHNDLPIGAKFQSLNTQMTIMSKNFSYYLPSLNKNVVTIFASGTGTFHRNDIYGDFSAPYTFNEYFDPTTGYIVAYTYSEHDGNNDATFDYHENFYVTQTSYQLSDPTQNTPEFPISMLATLAIAGSIVVMLSRFVKRNGNLA